MRSHAGDVMSPRLANCAASSFSFFETPSRYRPGRCPGLRRRGLSRGHESELPSGSAIAGQDSTHENFVISIPANSFNIRRALLFEKLFCQRRCQAFSDRVRSAQPENNVVRADSLAGTRAAQLEPENAGQAKQNDGHDCSGYRSEDLARWHRMFSELGTAKTSCGMRQ